MVERIDRLRDPLVPRERYVRWLLGKALETEERKAGKRQAIVVPRARLLRPGGVEINRAAE